MIDYDLVKEIKQRADIVDVIQYFLPTVQKKGRNYVAVCPFHDDHDPSMQINKEKQTFACYACQSFGDVFEFVQKYDKCTFEESILKVCEIIGFDDPRLHKKTYSKPVDENLAPVYKCITELQKFYQYCINIDEGQKAIQYLNKRSISSEQINKFKLGYSLDDGSKTIQYLQQKGFSLKNIENTGISLASASGMKDNNSGRLIFPICDSTGQVVGFSARKIHENDDSPKYVNTTETVIFKKGDILYNLNNAKQTIKHDGFVYVVEGFMDVFALDEIGINSVVALMSTKLTKSHIEQLRRFNVELRICLDCDKPGQEAMMKIMSQLSGTNIQYRFVSMPEETRDPDEILKESGAEVLKKFANSLVEPFEFALNYYKNTSPLQTTEDKKKVINYFIPIINSMNSKLDQDNYIFKLSEITNYNQNALRNLMKERNKTAISEVNDNRTVYHTTFNIKKLSKELRRLTIAERSVLEMMCYSKDAVDFFEQHIKYFYIDKYREISNYIIDECSRIAGKTVEISNIMTNISMINPENKDELINELTDISFKKDKLVYSEEVMNDFAKVINEERESLYKRKELQKQCEGKTTEEQAKLYDEYMSHLKKIEKIEK